MDEQSLSTISQQSMLDLIEHHRHAELDEFDVAATLETMSQDPYLLFMGTGGGGEGRESVRAFYARMVNQIPSDLSWTPISTTVGIGRVVIETILGFTHSLEMDWLLPGVKATNAKVEIPMIIIFSFQGDKIKSERLYWDQAATLLQLGLPVNVGRSASEAETVEKLKRLAGSV